MGVSLLALAKSIYYFICNKKPDEFLPCWNKDLGFEIWELIQAPRVRFFFFLFTSLKTSALLKFWLRNSGK